jgi:hypothetical protein
MERIRYCPGSISDLMQQTGNRTEVAQPEKE